MGDNANRHIKAYDIYGSTDNSDWTLLCSDDNAPAKSSFRVILDKAADIRYFKIVVRQTTAKDGPFLRIYEMNVASGAVATAINHITVNNGQTSANGATYNISGQRISEDAKGIVIKNGKIYHRSGGCKNLPQNAIRTSVPLATALKRGKTPCSVCCPPAA